MSIAPAQNDESSQYKGLIARRYHAPVLTLDQKLKLMRNLELEILSRASHLRAQYSVLAQGFRSKLESRVRLIPSEILSTKIGDLLGGERSVPRANKPASIATKPLPPPPALPQPTPSSSSAFSILEPPGIKKPCGGRSSPVKTQLQHQLPHRTPKQQHHQPTRPSPQTQPQHQQRQQANQKLKIKNLDQKSERAAIWGVRSRGTKRTSDESENKENVNCAEAEKGQKRRILTESTITTTSTETNSGIVTRITTHPEEIGAGSTSGGTLAEELMPSPRKQHKHGGIPGYSSKNSSAGTPLARIAGAVGKARSKALMGHGGPSKAVVGNVLGMKAREGSGLAVMQPGDLEPSGMSSGGPPDGLSGPGSENAPSSSGLMALPGSSGIGARTGHGPGGDVEQEARVSAGISSGPDLSYSSCNAPVNPEWDLVSKDGQSQAGEPAGPMGTKKTGSGGARGAGLMSCVDSSSSATRTAGRREDDESNWKSQRHNLSSRDNTGKKTGKGSDKNKDTLSACVQNVHAGSKGFHTAGLSGISHPHLQRSPKHQRLIPRAGGAAGSSGGGVGGSSSAGLAAANLQTAAASGPGGGPGGGDGSQRVLRARR